MKINYFLSLFNECCVLDGIFHPKLEFVVTNIRLPDSGVVGYL